MDIKRRLVDIYKDYNDKTEESWKILGNDNDGNDKKLKHADRMLEVESKIGMERRKSVEISVIVIILGVIMGIILAMVMSYITYAKIL